MHETALEKKEKNTLLLCKTHALCKLQIEIKGFRVFPERCNGAKQIFVYISFTYFSFPFFFSSSSFFFHV